MAILTGSEIQKMRDQGRIHISPFDDKRVGINSYDLALGNKIKTYTGRLLSTKSPNVTYEHIIPEEGFILMPGVGYIGHTIEECGSDEFVCYVDGRSSFGRLFVLAHCTAGRGDLGFCDGRRREVWTLEIAVVGNIPVMIFPGDMIAQATFHTTVGDRKKLYEGRYAGHTGPTESKMWK